MELLPAIDILDGKAVRLEKGDYSRATVYNDDPVAQARQFEQAGADWVHVVDLDGARDGAPVNVDIVRGICEKTLLKVEVGGGVRTMDALQRYSDMGVSRVVLGTALVADKAFAEEAYSRFGAMITAGIDARDGEVAVEGWREGAGVPADELIAYVRDLGIQHLVYTDIARDGMRCGIDAATYKAAAETFRRSVIASGGVAGLDDLKRLAAVADQVEGVITGRAIYEGSLDVEEGVRFCRETTRAACAARMAADPCGTGGLPC